MQKIGFILIAAGVLVVIGYLGWDFFTSADISLTYRVAAGVAAGGILLLLASVIRERHRASRKEDFKEVER
ncbi:hypothetical protein ACFLX5_01625 [Chloroflexota bacterium]